MANSNGDLEVYVNGKLVDYKNGVITGTQTFSGLDYTLGGFLELNGLTLTFQSIVYSAGTDTYSGTVIISAASGTLFPGKAFTASATDGADPDSTGITGSYNVGSKVFGLTIDQFQLTVGEAVAVNASSVSVSYDASNAAANQTVMAIASATINSSLFSGLASVALSNFTLRKDGFHIGDATISLGGGGSATISDFLKLSGLQISVDDLDVSYSVSTTVTGSVSISASGLSLFSNGSLITTTATGLTGTYDFSGANPTAKLSLTIASLNLTIGEALSITATGVTVTPGAPDVIATIASAAMNSPQFTGLGNVTLSNFVLHRSGFTVGNASLTTTLAGLGQVGDAFGKILKFDTVTVSVTNFAVNYGTNVTVTGSITLSATNVVLFPEVSFINASLGNITGSYQFGTLPGSIGVLNLDLPAFDLPIGEALLLHFGAVQLRPGQDVMLSVSNVSVASNLVAGLSGTISSFQLRRSGFTIGSLTLSAAGTNNIGSLLTLSGAALVVSNFVLDRTAVNKVTGTISLNVAGVTLLPDSSYIQTSVTGLSATYDFSNGITSSGDLSLSIASLQLTIAQTSVLSASNVVIVPGNIVQAGNDDLSLSLTGSLTVLGQVIEGSFQLVRSNSVTTISATITKLELEVNGTRIVQLTGNGEFLVTPDGLAGGFALNLALGPALSGFNLAGNFVVQVNTTGSNVVFGTATIPAGPYFRVAIQSASITVLGNTITADLFQLVKSGSGASAKITAVASGVAMSLQAATASLTVSAGSGAFLITSAGVAGYLDIGTVVLTGVPGVSLGAADLSIQLNTTGADVSATTITTTQGDVVIEYAGAYNHNFIRVMGTGSLDVDGFMKLTGGFAFERSTIAGGAAVLKGSVTNLSGVLGTGAGTANEAGIKVTDINGAFLLLPAGLALDATGTASLVGMSGLTLTGSVAVQVNTTAQAINETVTTPTGSASVHFTNGGEYLAVSGALNLEITGFISLSGAYSFEKSSDGATTKVVVGATGVTAFMGDGTTGVRLTGGTLGLVLYPQAGTYALTMSGTATLLGISGVTLNGTVSARANTTGLVVNELITTALGSNVVVAFADTTIIKRLEGTVALDIGGFATLTGAYSFEKSGTGATSKVLVGATDVEAFMGVGTAGVRIQNAQLALALYPATSTYALSAIGTATLEGVTDVVMTGSLEAAVNTTGAAVNENIATPTGVVALQFSAMEGNLMRFRRSGVQVAIGDAIQIAGNFAVERKVISGQATLQIGASGVQALMSVNGKGVRISDATLGMLVLPDGTYALQAAGSATVVGVPDLEVTGDLKLDVNTTGAARAEVIDTGARTAGGQAINVTLALAGNVPINFVGANIVLKIAGNGYTASEVTFKKSVNQIDVTGTDIAYTLQAGTRRILSIQDADFAFVVTPDGVAGALRNATVNGPDFGGNITLGGTVSLLLNTTTTSQTLTVGGQSVTVAAAAAGSNYLRVEIATATLVVYGSSLTADLFVLEKDEFGVRVSGNNLDFTLAAGAKRIIGIQDANFAFRFTQAGVVGAVKNGTIQGPDFNGDITLAGTVSLAFNTTTSATALNVAGSDVEVAAATNGGFYVRVEVVNGVLAVFGNQLSADTFELEKSGSDVSVSGTNLDFTLAAGGTRVLSLADASFAFKFSSTGIAGAVIGGQFTGPDFSGVSVTGTVSLLVNTTTTEQNLGVNGSNVIVAAAPVSGHYVRVELTTATFTVLGNTLAMDELVFEQSGANVSVTGTNLSLQLTAGTNRLLGIQNASFVFQFTAAGVAGAIVDATILGPNFNGLTLAGTVTVLFNTTTTLQNLTVAGNAVAVAAGTAGAAYVKVKVDNGQFGILGQTLSANFVFEQTTVAGESVVSIKASSVGLVLGSGSTNLVTVAGGST